MKTVPIRRILILAAPLLVRTTALHAKFLTADLCSVIGKPFVAVALSIFLSLLVAGAKAAAVDALTFTVAPRTTVIERKGITGGGQPIVTGDRTIVLYPNHPDDFGGSGGTGASVSNDGGDSWQQLPDDWPLPKMVDLWADRLRNGDLLAFGIRGVPDPKKRGVITTKDVPADAYRIAISKDQGRTWTAADAVIECPAEFGVIARPLPHIIEDESGALLMPAYAWGKGGTRALLLKSVDRGRRWTVLATIATAAAMVKAGAPITTPWLETTVAITKDGSLLAVIRTGSSAGAALMSARSSDHGKTWSAPEQLLAGPKHRPVAGKLPTLLLLPNGVLTLLTAHTKNHCRILASANGTGREWSEAHIITSQSGGNAGMTVTGDDAVLITTPANGRIDAWHLSIRPQSKSATNLASPTNFAFSNGVLSWSAVDGAAAYRVTPMLIKPADGYAESEVYPHATIQTHDATPKLDLSRQLLIGGAYIFEVEAVDRNGCVSRVARSAATVNGPN